MESVNLLEIKGTGNLIPQLLKVVEKGNTDNETVDQIAVLTGNQTHAIFGFTVSDFALASLIWIDTPYSIKKFDEVYMGLDLGDKVRVQDMIANRRN